MVVAEVGTIAIAVKLLINIDRGLRDRDKSSERCPRTLSSTLLALGAEGTLETGPPTSFLVTWVTCVYFLLPSLKPTGTCVSLSGMSTGGLASAAAV